MAGASADTGPPVTATELMTAERARRGSRVSAGKDGADGALSSLGRQQPHAVGL